MRSAGKTPPIRSLAHRLERAYHEIGIRHFSRDRGIAGAPGGGKSKGRGEEEAERRFREFENVERWYEGAEEDLDTEAGSRVTWLGWRRFVLGFQRNPPARCEGPIKKAPYWAAAARLHLN